MGAIASDPLYLATKVAEAVLSQASVLELAEVLRLSKAVAHLVQELLLDTQRDLSSPYAWTDDQ